MTNPTAPVDTIVVCGPTASGKTRLGVAIARHVGGEILSADSRQVYRGMDIGTGKDLGEYGQGAERVQLHLVDIVDPAQVYSLWRFQTDFYASWQRVRDGGHMPVVVGGSGLYLEAVLKGYRVANVAGNEELRAELMGLDKQALQQQLQQLDPELYERADRSSKKRIVRAIEVARAHRRGQAHWGHDRIPSLHPYVIGVRWPRPVLHERIRLRLDSRLAGLVDEVRVLMANGVSAQRLEQIGLEYRYAGRLLRGETTETTMRDELYHAICRFAKRQETWFRGMERRGTAIRWIDGCDVSAAIAAVDAALATL